MAGPLFAIVGDIKSTRSLAPPIPPLQHTEEAQIAAQDLGTELARRGARLLVYGGEYLETDVVRGFVEGKPKQDHSILMWYSQDVEPPPFAEEQSHPKLFQRRSEKGGDWEVAFYRAVARADGIILMGGGSATKISGQVAIGARMPILAFPRYGGGAAVVWNSLSPGEDLPTRDEIELMSKRWGGDSADGCINALYAQLARRQIGEGTPAPAVSIIAGLLFLLALAIVPWVWGQNALAVWMLFIVPLLAGGAGGAIRLMVDRQSGVSKVASAVLAALILGFVAGGVAGVLFITAQMTAVPNVTAIQDIAQYAQRTIPYALGVGFVSGYTSDTVFGKLRGLDVIRVTGISTPSAKS